MEVIMSDAMFLRLFKAGLAVFVLLCLGAWLFAVARLWVADCLWRH